jgi:hypothetical protein
MKGKRKKENKFFLRNQEVVCGEPVRIALLAKESMFEMAPAIH